MTFLLCKGTRRVATKRFGEFKTIRIRNTQRPNVSKYANSVSNSFLLSTLEACLVCSWYLPWYPPWWVRSNVRGHGIYSRSWGRFVSQYTELFRKPFFNNNCKIFSIWVIKIIRKTQPSKIFGKLEQNLWISFHGRFSARSFRIPSHVVSFHFNFTNDLRMERLTRKSAAFLKP